MKVERACGGNVHESRKLGGHGGIFFSLIFFFKCFEIPEKKNLDFFPFSNPWGNHFKLLSLCAETEMQ